MTGSVMKVTSGAEPAVGEPEPPDSVGSRGHELRAPGRSRGNALLGAQPAGRWAVPEAHGRRPPAHRPLMERPQCGRRCVTDKAAPRP
jgi:hypothetical protein